MALAASVLALCLFGASPALKSSAVVSAGVQEVAAVLRDPETQWMALLCAGAYFATFTLLQSRRATARFWSLNNPDLWLAGTLLIGAFIYALDYSAASHSTQALTLLGGAALGKGAGLWAGLKSRKQKAESRNGSASVILVPLVALLVLASLWHPDLGRTFQYRGDERWSGPWDNPNVYGLLMGAGLILAVGLFVQSLTSTVQGRETEARSWKFGVGRCAAAILCLVAAALMGRGLLHSYSRGAWVAAVCGLAYLVWNLRLGNTHLTPALSPRPPGGEGESLSCVSFISRLKKSWLPLSVVVLSAVVLAFWQFRHTEQLMARRAFSVGNVNDFSWRNRLAAWEGALEIAAEHPWFGVGWNQPEPMYEHYYRPNKVTEAAAIEMNDYLVLGATLGIPALVCFAAYLWLVLCRNSESRIQNSEFRIQNPASASPPTLDPGPSPSPPTLDFGLWTLDSTRAVCRAGAIVLAVGFWFDGGLFKLATAAPFWILLELGSCHERWFSRQHEIQRPAPHPSLPLNPATTPLPSLSSPSEGEERVAKGPERRGS